MAIREKILNESITRWAFKRKSEDKTIKKKKKANKKEKKNWK